LRLIDVAATESKARGSLRTAEAAHLSTPALNNTSQKWPMPIRKGKAGMNRLTIQPGERVPRA
jgi:transposase-like protein